MTELEERVEKLERRARRGKILMAAKALFYIFLLVGVTLYLVGLYESRGEWKIELAGAPNVGVSGPTLLTVNIPVKIYDPDGPVTAKLVYYRLYVNNEYAGDGFTPYLDLKPGWTEHRFRVDIDVSKVGCGVATALSKGQPVEMRVEGYAMVDLKAFGKIPWKTVTVPFNYTVENVSIPTLPLGARSMLEISLYVCNNSERVLNILGILLNTSINIPTNISGGTVPGLVVSTKIAGGGYPVPVWVNITNNGSDVLRINNIKINNIEILSNPVILSPGKSLNLKTSTTVLPAVLTIDTDKGSYTKIITLGG